MFNFRGMRIPGKVTPIENGNYLALSFGWNETFKEEIKAAFDARWKPEIKSWVIPANQRANFLLRYYQGEDVFAPWSKEPNFSLMAPTTRPLYQHQRDMTAAWLTTRMCVWGAEMGVGKTLSAIEALENIIKLTQTPGVCWFVGPRNAISAVKLDFRKWQSQVAPSFMTYENMISVVKTWQSKNTTPMILIFDEAHLLKNPKSQRSQCAQHLADSVRLDWGEKAHILLMTGTPSPKSPWDWWNLCEIACPGFVREGTWEKFRRRVSLIETGESLSGVKYPKLITHFDNPLKCRVCGHFPDHPVHLPNDVQQLVYVPGTNTVHESPHPYKESVDEVSKVYRRLKGLVVTKLKDECLDLPAKVYRTIKLDPSPQIIGLAKVIRKRYSAAQAMIHLRELSDGFQYVQEKRTKPCDRCVPATRANCKFCAGNGELPYYEDVTKKTDCPKDQALVEIMEERDRLIVFAGFTASIDRVCAIVVSEGWDYIRLDGRGWHTTLPGKSDPERLIPIFQKLQTELNRAKLNKGIEPSDVDLTLGLDDARRICFVGHPQSAGMSLTLTASDTTVYFSNDFKAENRMQSEDRNHRIGTRGCNIIDLIHLPIDQLVLDNLKAKRELQRITMGDINSAFGDQPDGQ